MSGYSGIYVGWVGYRNLGDEAMFAVCRERFLRSRWRPFGALSQSLNVKDIVSRNRDSRHLRTVLADEVRTGRRIKAYAAKISHELSSVVNKEVGLFGGGTILNRNQLTLDEYTAVRKRTRSPLPIFGTGVASPSFWSREPGWRDRRKDWATLLNELPSVGVRGPHSKDLLEEVGVKNVRVCGDPAIAFHRRFRNNGHEAASGRRQRIAINTGDCSGKSWGDSERVQDCLAALVREVVENGHDVSVIPVWPQDVAACFDLAKSAGLPHRSVLSVQDVPESFLATIQSFDMIVALKLHAAILAAAANVPFVLLEYQPKAIDFAASIGMEEFTMRTDHVTPSGLIELVSRLLAELPQTRAKVCTNMCTMLSTFDEYCNELDRLIFA